MNSIVDIANLSSKEKAALVTMYYARFKTDSEEYANFTNDLSVLSQCFGIKINTLKNHRDAFDACYDNNERKGWHDVPLKKRDSTLFAIYTKYGDIDVSLHKEIVDDILDYCASIRMDNGKNFITLRVQKPSQAHNLLDNSIVEFEVDEVYSLYDAIKKGAVIFLSLGGDTGTKEVDWERGFYAIGHISQEPYDIGYNKNAKKTNYYKFKVTVDWRALKPYPKEFFQYYPGSYDSPYIGLELHRDPTQAICQMSEDKAVSIIRAVVDDNPSLLSKMETIFSADFIDKVKGKITRLIPVSSEFGKTNIDNSAELTVPTQQHIIDESTRIFYGTNIIYYGIPGCGKSHKVNEEHLKKSDAWTRIVFHPDYTNADFIGQILPQVNEDKTVSYDFVPGQFTTAIKNAYEHPTQKHVFVIEEINRGNAAAIFGETFQLLDRLAEEENGYPAGTSKYGIKNENMAQKIYGNKDHEIRIPSNLSIVATMNTSDQNVFTLDTAFKRRWQMKNVLNDFSNCSLRNESVCGTGTTWVVFVKTINAVISQLNATMINSEDKRLGAYFVTAEELASQDMFAEKVLAYLWDDALKFNRDKVFISGINTLEDLFAQFRSLGLKVFTDYVKNTSEQFKV